MTGLEPDAYHPHPNLYQSYIEGRPRASACTLSVLHIPMTCAHTQGRERGGCQGAWHLEVSEPRSQHSGAQTMASARAT